MKRRNPTLRTNFFTKLVVIVIFMVGNLSLAQVFEGAGRTWHGDRRNTEMSEYEPRAWTGPRMHKGLNLYSRDKEQKLGRKLAFDFEHAVTILDDQILSDYLAGVVGNLASHSEAKQPFTVKVVADEGIQAYSLPGEHLYVTTGLLLACSNEAELAGALSHEIAHDAGRHGTRQLTRKILLSSVLAPAVLFAGNRAVIDLSVVFGPLSLNSTGRRFEYEADLAGIHYSYLAGYDPSAFIDLLQRIAIQIPDKHNSIVEQFRNHPRIWSRLKRLRQEISHLASRNDYLLVDSSDFQDAKAHLVTRVTAKPSETQAADSPPVPTIKDVKR
jgi:predicted Zn-dependent protease